MKLAKEIAQQLDDDMVDNCKAYGDSYVDQDYVELMIAKKLEPVRNALKKIASMEAPFKRDVLEFANSTINMCERTAKDALAMFDDE